MQKLLLVVFASLLALTLADASPATAAASQDSEARALQIKVSSTHRTYACHNPGDAVQVTGSSDILTITGNCGSLQITGSSNSITIDSVQSMQFTGNSNTVLYRSSHSPTINDNGQSNSVPRASGQVTASHGNDAVTTSDQNGSTTVNGAAVGSIVSNALQAANAASQAAASTAGTVQGVQNTSTTLNIILSRQQTTQDCGDGKTVNINGYQDDITLTGSCGKVILNGWGNTVHIEEVAAIEVMGHTNTIFWERGRNVRKPVVQIDNRGTNNSVRHLTQANQ